jgi:hypothetical protein
LAPARPFRLAASACAGLAAVVLLGAMVLNANALSAENGIVSDGAFGPLVMGILLALGACVLGARSAIGSAGSPGFVIALSFVLGCAAVIGAFLILGEPAVFNAGYGCLGRADVWLAVAMRPTPAPCGYLIPQADNALFYPAALASFAAAALGVTCAILTFVSRVGRST